MIAVEFYLDNIDQTWDFGLLPEMETLSDADIISKYLPKGGKIKKRKKKQKDGSFIDLSNGGVTPATPIVVVDPVNPVTPVKPVTVEPITDDIINKVAKAYTKAKLIEIATSMGVYDKTTTSEVKIVRAILNKNPNFR